MKKDKSHGGKREGAGAKLKYGEPTVTIPAFRVPASKEIEAREMIKEFLNKCLTSIKEQ